MKVRPGVVSGVVRAPRSKSITHRALLLAAQSEVPCVVQSPLRGGDTHATLSALFSLGARYETNSTDTRFTPSHLSPPSRVLDCENSGTTLRLMTATCARMAGTTHFDGDMSLRGRPSTALLAALKTLGATTKSEQGKAPLSVKGPIHAGKVSLPADSSSQFASALLLSLPMLAGDSTILLKKPVVSRPYLDITMRCMNAFQLDYAVDENDKALRFTVPGGQEPNARVVYVPGDWSGAAFPLAAAAITGGRVMVEGLDAEDGQGDAAILDHLAAFGATTARTETTALVEGAALSSPGHVDLTATPDLFPILCVVAAAAHGTTDVVGSSQLRVKESDRIRTTAEGLRAIGVEVQELEQGLRITGGTIKDGVVKTHGDHRIHMAFAVAGLVSRHGIKVDHDDAPNVSYPGFYHDLAKLGAEVLDDYGPTKSIKSPRLGRA